MQKILLCGLLLFSLSCKKNPAPETFDMGFNYFPLDSGNTSIYHVDSISYNDNNHKIDTFHFYLMEKITGIVKDQNFKDHRIIERYVRLSDSTEWEQRANYYVLKTQSNLQIVEENNRIVKLVFPTGNTQSWNGNMFNSLGQQTFYLLNQGGTYQNKDTIFTNTITVLEAKEDNPVEEVLIKSVYAKNVGLVHLTNTYINTQSTGRAGYKVFQELISFTKQ